jgi:hypothetical protein
MPKIDAGPTIQSMDRLLNSVAFGIARGLTQVAKLSATTVTAALPADFDRPNPFTMQGISFTPATRDSLIATVFVKDAQAAYLELEETGGSRTPQPGSPINIPVDLKTNAYGNIPRGRIAALKASGRTFIANGKGKNPKLPPGLYARPKYQKTGYSVGRPAKGQTRPKVHVAMKDDLLVAFDKRAAYKPRLGFEASVTSTVSSQGSAIIERSVADAIATTR